MKQLENNANDQDKRNNVVSLQKNLLLVICDSCLVSQAKEISKASQIHGGRTTSISASLSVLFMPPILLYVKMNHLIFAIDFAEIFRCCSTVTVSFT